VIVVRVLRVIAATGVLAMAGVLGWRLAHQHNGTAKAIASGKIVKAPAFRLKALSGDGTVSLAALRGKMVVLNFWASNCIPCKEEMPRLQRASERWAGRHVAVVGIDVEDSRRAARSFLRAHGITYEIGFDPLADTAGPYGVLGTPSTFFIDRRGRIVKRILGPVSRADLDTQIGRALSS
jgi:cytochrome c biogenesis protein CcmG, thiol:disulfide interchange protein DsbE